MWAKYFRKRSDVKLVKTGILFSLIALLLVGLMFACGNPDVDPDASPLASIPLEKVLANGEPTLAEFGWRECIPCKAMRPILEELDKEYKGKLNVVIVEIPFHEDLAEKYGIRVMPVQIFFDSKGNEVTRHAGFLPKEQIIPQLERMGIAK
ncbi:thioredoxin family protein [Chloroflexota bacterium]